jgi:hypothetical protein
MRKQHMPPLVSHHRDLAVGANHDLCERVMDIVKLVDDVLIASSIPRQSQRAALSCRKKSIEKNDFARRSGLPTPRGQRVPFDNARIAIPDGRAK